MKPKSNYTRVMAGFYIFLCLIASLILGEIIYFVAIVPLISNHIWLPFINIIWIYIVAVIYYKLTRRYTKWWKKLENKHPPLYQMVEKTGKQTITLMPIIVNLDVMMAKRKVSLGELAERVDLTPANLSILKTGKAKAVRFSTLEAICKELDCQPGDILEYRAEE